MTTNIIFLDRIRPISIHATCVVVLSRSLNSQYIDSSTKSEIFLRLVAWLLLAEPKFSVCLKFQKNDLRP